ncbi:MAG: hypothetical protein ACRC92_25840 [Peptostreptococcaceae bacterium]
MEYRVELVERLGDVLPKGVIELDRTNRCHMVGRYWNGLGKVDKRNFINRCVQKIKDKLDEINTEFVGQGGLARIICSDRRLLNEFYVKLTDSSGHDSYYIYDTNSNLKMGHNKNVIIEGYLGEKVIEIVNDDSNLTAFEVALFKGLMTKSYKPMKAKVVSAGCLTEPDGYRIGVDNFIALLDKDDSLTLFTLNLNRYSKKRLDAVLREMCCFIEVYGINISVRLDNNTSSPFKFVHGTDETVIADLNKDEVGLVKERYKPIYEKYAFTLEHTTTGILESVTENRTDFSHVEIGTMVKALMNSNSMTTVDLIAEVSTHNSFNNLFLKYMVNRNEESGFLLVDLFYSLLLGKYTMKSDDGAILGCNVLKDRLMRKKTHLDDVDKSFLSMIFTAREMYFTLV